MSTFLIDQFVTTKPGDPFRLFPFGTVTKNGRTRVITPEMAGQFKLPHFKPAIKLGSHAEATPAGGHIIGLEVRGDGLYAVPEWNESGTTAVTSGSYRYHSPEVIWEGGGLEDANTGQSIDGPLIVGVALLHMPALGEQAALYSVEKFNGGKNMTQEMVQVPVSLWDKFLAIFDQAQNEPDKPPEKPPAADNFEAEKAALVAKYEAEKAEYDAKIQALEAEKRQASSIAHFTAELKDTAVSGNAELIGTLAGLEKTTAEKLVTEFKALSAQIDSNLTNPVGSNPASANDPQAAINAEVTAYMAANKVPYHEAFKAITVTKPELFVDLYGGQQ